MEKLYTTKQVAEILGLTPNTIRLYVREGKIKATRVGGERVIMRISESDIKAYIKNTKK